MPAAGDDARGSHEGDELGACCRRVAVAHAAQDREQTAGAVSELYRHLADRGWVAPPRAAALLRLQSAVLDAADEHVLVVQARCE